MQIATHGILASSASAVAPSFSNTKSLVFDGVDDFVSCGSDASLQFSNTLTVSCWVKTTTSGVGIIAQRKGNTPTQEAFTITSSGEVRMNNNVRITASTSILDGNWHHIAFTYNTTIISNNLKIYIDGSLDNSVNRTTVVGGTGSNTLYIGEFRGANFFSGHIDEIAIWNTELSASDITSIYNSGSPADLTSLSPLSWWRNGDGDTYPTLNDNGSASNNGTMTNMTSGDIVTDVP